MALSDRTYELNVQVRKFEGKFAVLEGDDGHLIDWPIKVLPDEVEIGTPLRLSASTERTDEAAREKLARAVLNNILGG